MGSEVWGSTKVNLNNGYVFQICGGGEKGVVGKKEIGTRPNSFTFASVTAPLVTMKCCFLEMTMKAFITAIPLRA